ncbi:MAG: M12 family metallo-peptidase, partial [Gammaproteobacteria bacterium]|nr:M12 family metallo-peptidase [Gammaproteobacteria bacterium]
MLTRTLLLTGLMLLAAGTAGANSAIWRELPSQDSIAPRGAADVEPVARRYEADNLALRGLLAQAPHETSGDLSHQLYLPMPDGSLLPFSVVESPIVAPGLAARFPGIRSFKVAGVDGERAAGRIDITPLGFHGMIETADGMVYINPEDFRSQDNVYLSRFTADDGRPRFSCGVQDHSRDLSEWVKPRSGTASRVSGNLLEYDLAVAATLEYHQYFGSSVANTYSAIFSTMSNVNFVYERDLGIRLVLVADNNLLYETMDFGLLNNNDEFVLLGQVNDWIDSRLPGSDSAYDIGHMFSRPPPFIGGGGVARLGAVCDNSNKAGGVSGSPDPIGPKFDIELVAHEIGHQFNADHSFNGTSEACFNRNAGTAYEPGSGSTIMSYAGICPDENLQSTSDATFHASSIAQIGSFTAAQGSCYTLIQTPPAPALANVDPVIAAGADTAIPANTPFILESSASDADTPLSSLRYQWDQMDSGCSTNSNTFGTDNGSNALFRSYLPRAEAWRNFPALGTQVEGRYDKAEVLPCNDRDLNFRVTVRDGSSGQGFEDVRVTIDSSAGPFEITSLMTPQILTAGVAFPVDWNVANTDLAPINCANVDIELLVFSAGYSSYSSYPLAMTTPNDSSQLVTITPADRTISPTSKARIRVKCSDNIFYDISD